MDYIFCTNTFSAHAGYALYIVCALVHVCIHICQCTCAVQIVSNCWWCFVPQYASLGSKVQLQQIGSWLLGMVRMYYHMTCVLHATDPYLVCAWAVFPSLPPYIHPLLIKLTTTGSVLSLHFLCWHTLPLFTGCTFPITCWKCVSTCCTYLTYRTYLCV